MSDVTLRKVGKMFTESEAGDKYMFVVTSGSGSESDRSEVLLALRGPTTSVAETGYTVVAADSVILVDDDTAGGAVTVTLLAAATAGDSYQLVVKKLGTTGNVVLSCSDNIDGATTATLANQYEAVTLVCDGSTYHII